MINWRFGRAGKGAFKQICITQKLHLGTIGTKLCTCLNFDTFYFKKKHPLKKQQTRNAKK